jgi:3-oxoacyl-[acyl-carrier protein] reductase
MPVTLSLTNKVALITGGSRGIGAATVRLFAAAGAKVIFSYQHARAQAEALAKECGQRLGRVNGEDNCRALQGDLNTAEAAAALVAAAAQQFGRIDILVANHGVWPAEDVAIESMTTEQWRNTLAINLDAVFGLIKPAVAQMKSQSPQGAAAGHIVLISSTSAQRGEAYHCDYSASKGALISMTKGLSTELAPAGIYVNTVAPGWVDTDMSRPALDDPKVAPGVLGKIPMGRVGTPEEIAGPILFLCTPYAGFITGEIFNVNGGAVLVG